MEWIKLMEEIRFYNSKKEGLLKHHAGKFVLIKDSKIIGYFKTSQEA